MFYWLSVYKAALCKGPRFPAAGEGGGYTDLQSDHSWLCPREGGNATSFCILVIDFSARVVRHCSVYSRLA